jgi:hypothetical protein
LQALWRTKVCFFPPFFAKESSSYANPGVEIMLWDVEAAKVKRFVLQILGKGSWIEKEYL